MALKASIGVLLGCQFGSANKLLHAAERGEDAAVRQVIDDKPLLAAFTGFHGTTSALHRAAVKGHLGVCRAIIEPLKQRIREAETAAAKLSGAAGAAKWRRLLATVLNQRTHKSNTPLMLACEHGNAGVTAYLLREGADPLATDFVHSRTCLHYAAVGGHADCLRLLCSDSAQVAGPDGSSRPLRDVVVADMQVQSCRYIDQRAFGGLTALHFAAVTGSLEAVQALLRAGASIMVKSDGEAYIGEDHLVPGSTPLHVAVIVNSISIVHAILQAHMEMMNILGTRLDERGRRPWEGTSRTDIRSVRNQFRKLPFHLARERHQPQLMSLVDPRIPVDVALDAARDTEHGIGPKRLGTICSLVLQRSLLQWLDNCQTQLAREAAEKQRQAGAEGLTLSRQPSAVQQALAVVRGRRKGKPPAKAGPGSRPVSARPSADGSILLRNQQPREPSPAPAQQDGGSPTSDDGAAANASPFAALAGLDMPSPQARRLPVSASAPATPAHDLCTLGQQPSGAATVGSLPFLAAATVMEQQFEGGGGAEGSGLHRMASLHGYMGMLSLKRPQPSSRSADVTQRGQQAGAIRRTPSGARQASASVVLAHPGSSGAGPQQAARVRFLSEPGVAAADAVAMADAESGPESAGPASPRDLAAGSAAGDAAVGLQQANIITIKPHHRRPSLSGNRALGSVLNRLRSADGTPAGIEALAAADASAQGGQHIAAVAAALLCDKHSEKDLALDSEGEACSPSEQSEEDVEDVECGVCLDAVVEVAFASCQHKLCLECARNLTRQDKKPPHCPFCRRLVVGFQRVSSAGMLIGGRSSGMGVRAGSPAQAHRLRAQ